MPKIIPVFLCLALISSAEDYDPIKAEPVEAYEVIPIEGDPYVQREYLGDLDDYPDMYELTSDVAFTIKIRVRQRDSRKAVPFGLILVRQNDEDGGVSEIARLNQPVAEWTPVRESMLGMKFLEGSLIEKELKPGTYRVEVSTPDNKGDYMLILGDEPVRTGYFASLGDIYKTQRHFGYTPLHMLFSSYLYYPLGIMFVIYGIYYTWQCRKKHLHG